MQIFAAACWRQALSAGTAAGRVRTGTAAGRVPGLAVPIMHSRLHDYALESLVMFSEALTQAGIHDFVVRTFGAGVTMVKAEDTPWDAACQHALLQQLHCAPQQQEATMDADAVDAAQAVLAASPRRGAAKKVFVLTDGYGSTSLRLAAALQCANEAACEVVGPSVAFDSSFVPHCFQHWVTAALPKALPDALSALAAAREDAASGSSDGAAVQMIPTPRTGLPYCLWHRVLQQALQRCWPTRGVSLLTASKR